MSDGARRGGAVVARGKIKVDARKATAKLREHMLVDLHLYATEIARVAVALSATAIDVSWDADDVVLTFDGRSLPPDAVACALDHVLAPDAGIAEGDALRLLGIGVSAALGLGPRFVDIYVVQDDRCARVRFGPRHVAEDADSEAPAVDDVPRPEGMTSGTRVHVRRRVGLDVLARAVRRDVPREIVLLFEAAREAPLVIRASGQPVRPTPEPAALLRVDLDDPSLTRGVLEVLAPARETHPHTIFMDMGVRLAEATLAGVWEGGDGALPLRVFVDGRKLPTNASRSEVRMDTDLLRRVRARVPHALAAALATMRAIVIDGERAPDATKAPRVGHAVEVLDGRSAVLDEALGAIAAEVWRARRAGKKLSAEEEALLYLPLLRDAAARPMTLASLRASAKRPAMVYSGSAPVPEGLAPFVKGIVWSRGRAVERVLADLPRASANEHIAKAHEGHARRQRAMEHPPSRPVLAASSSYLLKEAFVVREGPFAGLEGEVAVARREGGYRRSANARLFVDDRMLETVPLPGVGLPIDVALSWPQRIKARLTYDAVERTDSVSHAVLYALRIAAMAIGERLGQRDPELVRLAMVAWAGATRTLGDAAVTPRALGKLAREAVWPTADGAMVSLEAIAAYATRTRAVCVAGEAAGKAPDGRPVVLAEHASALTQLLPEKTTVVDYTRTLSQPASATSEALSSQAAQMLVAVGMSYGHVEGFVGIGANRRRIFHGGMLLKDHAHAYRNGPVLVVLEDRAAVPSPSYDDVLWSGTIAADTAKYEDALLELVIARCENGELDPAIVAEYLAAAKRKLATRAKGKSSAREVSAALLARIADLPARVERARLERAKSLVMSRTPWGEPVIDRSVPSARVDTPHGSVTVVMARDAVGVARSGAPADVLFQRHPVCAQTLADLPVMATVDVTREEHLADWAGLSESGLRWARKTLGGACAELARTLVHDERFADDEDAMTLVEALLGAFPEVVSKVTAALRRAKWPTVQGRKTPLTVSKELPIGTNAYAPWLDGKSASPFDAPAIHVPRGRVGDLRRRVLSAAGYTLTDVSAQIERLQSLRARDADVPAPTLPGTPAHPLLRASLAQLGATLCDGEIELFDGTVAEITRVDARGMAEPFFNPVEPAVRAIFRAGEVHVDAITAELTMTAERHVRRMAPHLDRMPPFVRDRLRALVCESIQRDQRSAEGDAYPVFLSTSGTYWSLAQILKGKVLSVTRDPPPWPVQRPGVFFLTAAEAGVLGRLVAIDDVTEALRQERLGCERRAAPPVAAIGLSPETRARCMTSSVFEVEGVRGEVGLLPPSHAGARGILVHTTMRPLCTIDDGGTWPFVAVVDVDGIATTIAFDGIGERTEVMRIQRVVRQVIAAHAVTVLEAPPDAVGVVRLPFPFLARREGAARAPTEKPVPCLGVFWLEPTWPEAPSVHLEAIGLVDPFRAPLLPPGGAAHHRLLPIRGRLLVCAGQDGLDTALGSVFAHVLERLGPVVHSAARAVPPRAAPEELAAYTWDLSLLDARKDKDAIAELARDRPDPVLMRVAARRAPTLIDRATGDAPAPVPAPAPALAPALAPPLPDTPPGETFLRGLVRRVVSLVSAAPEPATFSPLTHELRLALTAMKLTGDPVQSVAESKRGRPVRYDAAERRVIVNAAHPSVRELSGDPARTLVLLAAAVSEINRELVPVTDAEEISVIMDLLRDGSDLS